MPYQHAIVTYMDLLGFARQINSGLDPDSVDAMLDTIANELKEHESPSIHNDVRTVCVSDAVIRALPIEPGHRIALQDLALEALILGIMQCRLIAHGLPVRGAMTCGNVSLSPTRFFGPAYQAAYSMESQQAKQPRIIIDHSMVDNLFDPLMMRPSSKDETLHEFGGVAKKDRDGRWFVDYLYIHGENADDDGDIIQFLLVHKQLIEGALQRYVSENRVLGKYRWMKRYHNQYVRALKARFLEEMEIEREALLIS